MISGSAVTIQILGNYYSIELYNKDCNYCDMWYRNYLIVVAATYGATVLAAMIFFLRIIYQKLAAYVSPIMMYFCIDIQPFMLLEYLLVTLK